MKVILVCATFLILASASLVCGQCYCGSYSQPVCGSNMVTYTNRCYMTCARVQLAYPGRCRGYGGLYGGGYGRGYGSGYGTGYYGSGYGSGYGTGYGTAYGGYGNLYRPTASLLG